MKRLISIIVGLSTLIVLTVLTSSAEASIFSHNLVIENVGGEPFRVCEHWNIPEKVSTSSIACKGGPIKLLRPGQNTKSAFGWKDADALVDDEQRQMKEDVVGINPIIMGCSDETRYRKVSPDINGYRKFYTKKKSC